MNKLTISVLLVALCASACLARTSPQIRRPFKFAPGQTYVYEYHGRQWNGLTKMADQYSGIDVSCDVILQALPESQGKEVLMKLDAIKVEQLHTQALENNDIRKLNQGKEVDQCQMSLYKEHLAKPIRFSYLDGKIVRFMAEQSEPEWSINLKKSVMSLFQLDLAPSKIIKSTRKLIDEQIYGQLPAEEMIRGAQEMPLVYPIYEESFGGICETLYELDSVDNVEQRQQQLVDSPRDFYTEVLNVTKTVNYKNCLTDPSVSYDRHSFKVNTQTAKGRLFSKQPTFASSQIYPVPEELKQKYSNVYNSFDNQDNVASPVPVERHSYTKYNLTTAPQSSVFSGRRSLMAQIPAELLVIEGVYSEGKIKYEADGDQLVSDTQQTLKLVSCVPSVELARLAPEIQAVQVVEPRQPLEYQTIQCELSSQKLKFYQALQKFAQLKQMTSVGLNTVGRQQQQQQQQLFNHQLVLPFALSASWYPIVATGEQSTEQNLERLVEPERLAKEFEGMLVSLAEDVLSEDVAASKKAGEKVVRIVNTVAFLPKHKLVQVYERIVSQLQQAKQQQVQGQQRAQQQKPTSMVDNDLTSKFKIVRKLYLDSLPLAGTKHAVEMIEYLIESQRVKTTEAKELCESVPAHLRYPDTEIIDAFIRISQLPQVRKSRPLFASCSIAVGKMIGQAYAKSQDASYKPTTYESADRLPAHLRDDDLVKQVVVEADPRRQLPIDWNEAPIEQQLFERLVLDEQDLIKYVKLYKQMLGKAQTYHDKVIYIETLAHMRAPQVVPILEPFVSGRLSLGQCLGNQPLDINRPVEQSQWYNYYSRQTGNVQQQQLGDQSTKSKDWSEENSFGAEECNYMRTIAIYAMAHVARVSPNKVQALLLPVFDNTYEPYQIRIAAFTTMMLTKLDEHLLERVASQMWREPSKEVASFVVGSIDTMSKMTAPKLAPFKIAALKAKDSMPKQFLDTWKFSWMAGGDHFDWQKQTGLSWLAELVKSNVSSVPRAAYLHFGRFHGPTGSKFDNHLELGFTSKGLESLLREYINYNKQQELEQGDFNIVASIFENLYSAKDDIVKYYRQARDQIKSDLLWESSQKKLDDQESNSFSSNYFFKRQQPIDGVNSDQLSKPSSRSPKHLFESAGRSKRSITLQARTSSDDDEEAKLTVFAKLFDTTSYHALDKKQILQLLERADDYVKQAADELVMGGKLHYVKMVMPSSMWHMVPSQIGLPMIVTHRKPIVMSIKVDASQNGQLTSSAVSQYLRQQIQGQGNTVQNKLGQNFATLEGLNITALVHPKIMHSDLRFMFSVDQSVDKTYGVQVERSHQISLPVEVSVAYSREKQLVSLSAEPKTPNRVSWVKEAAKTFVAPLCLGSSEAQNWLGEEQLIRTPSQQSQYKRLQRRESFVPSIISGVQSLIQEPKEAQLAAIDELETPYKFEHNFVQKALGLSLYVEGVSDDEDVVRSMTKPELRKQTRGPLQWSKVEETDDIDQHSQSGPMAELLHVLDSAINRQSKYLEFYTTIQPDQPHKSPLYRVDFKLNDKIKQQLDKPTKIYQASIMAREPEQQIIMGRRVNQQQQIPVTPIEKQQQIWQSIEQAKRINKIQQQQEKQIKQLQQQQQQQIMLEAY